MRDGRQVGIIAEVARGAGTQRAVVLLPRAGDLHRNDRFLPRRDERGKIGFHVVPGVGEPLADGMVIEAGFAPPQQAVRPNERPAAAPGGPPPADAVAPPAARGAADWYGGSAEKDLSMLGRHGGDSTDRVPRALQDEILELPRKARSMPPGEAVKFIEERRDALRLHFETAMAAAQKSGDREALRELLALRAKTEPMMRRLRAEAAQASR